MGNSAGIARLLEHEDSTVSTCRTLRAGWTGGTRFTAAPAAQVVTQPLQIFLDRLRGAEVIRAGLVGKVQIAHTSTAIQ